jgi:hypothetical protein
VRLVSSRLGSFQIRATVSSDLAAHKKELPDVAN